MKEIQLTRGQVALVDDEDYDFLLQWKWHAQRTSVGFYAYRSSKKIAMHRVIMNCPPNLQVDHIDHNTLNNQKNNLRLCTSQQNARNKNKRHDCACFHKGVYLNNKKYGVRIFINKKSVFLGNYSTPQEAALVYDNAAIKYFGEFAKINFKYNG